MKIAVPGTGCGRCVRTHDAVREALARAGVEALETPAPTIDGDVGIAGRVPTVPDVVAPLRSGR